MRTITNMPPRTEGDTDGDDGYDRGGFDLNHSHW